MPCLYETRFRRRGGSSYRSVDKSVYALPARIGPLFGERSHAMRVKNIVSVEQDKILVHFTARYPERNQII